MTGSVGAIQDIPERRGLDAREALAGLLTAAGHKRLDLPIDLPGDPMAAVLAGLERHGLLGRWTRIEARELAKLSLPSLALAEGGGFLLLTNMRERMFQARDAHGDRLLPMEGPTAWTCLDLVPALGTGGLWAAMLAQMWSCRRSLASTLGAALLVQLLGLLQPQFTRIMLDRVFPEDAGSLFAVVIAAGTFLAFYRAWVMWLQSRFELFVETRIGFAAEQGLLAHLLRLPYPWLAARTVGEHLQGFLGIRTARDLLTGKILTTLMSGVGALGYLCGMFLAFPAAACWLALGTLAATAAAAAAGRQMLRMQEQAVAAEVRERALLVEILNGIGLIKASGAEEPARCLWMDLVRRRRDLDRKVQRSGLATTGAMDLVHTLMAQGTLFWGGMQVLNGRLRLGELMAFAMMTTSFQQAAAAWVQLFLDLVQMRPEMTAAGQVLQTETEAAPGLNEVEAESGPMLVRDLWFRYREDGPWIIQALELRLEPGERIVLRGPSGCGKSTLLKVLSGLYRPGKGKIGCGPGGTCSNYGRTVYLPQFVHLFNGTILENLTLLSGGATRQALMAVAERTGLAGMVRTLPMGYETLMAPGGINFSGGQRQLVALTAVLATQGRILLLDEAMANLDALQRQRLFTCGLFKGRTILLACHEEPGSPGDPELHGFRRWPWPRP